VSDKGAVVSCAHVAGGCISRQLRMFCSMTHMKILAEEVLLKILDKEALTLFR
jgi:hypothetical protein